MTSLSSTCDAPSELDTGGTKKQKVVLVSRETGTLWLIGWLFTIGFAHLSFWKGVLGVIVWPYFLGDYLAS
jgi:hypothetical protein